MSKGILKSAELTHRLYATVRGEEVQIGLRAISYLGTTLMIMFRDLPDHDLILRAEPWLPQPEG